MSTSYRTLHCMGESQWPSISHRDTIEIEEPGTNPIQPGDIVVFRRNKWLVCHRVIEVRRQAEECEYLTKGDAQSYFDGWTEHKNIVGRVIRVNGQKLNPWLKVIYFQSKAHLCLNRALAKSRVIRILGWVRKKTIGSSPVLDPVLSFVFFPWHLKPIKNVGQRYATARRKKN